MRLPGVRGWIRTTLVAGALVVLLGTLGGLWQFKLIGYDRIGGSATFDIDGAVGPDTGPVCSVDKRYTDEAPTGLRDDVAAAFTSLKAKATAQNVTLCLHDGKRSERQQQAQFDEYVTKMGTRELARQFALPPEESMHVKGIAVDIQPQSSAAWLERSAGSHGWCRRYDNEYWHFEYDPAYTKGCPPLKPTA
ncbi:MAG: D-alanyl-D-alanine carboxypeptidase family protein [Kibdelosporangium sp.]